ncbi:MAG: fibronectin type III domain-containing protein, partial [Geobacteraceae bacterium]
AAPAGVAAAAGNGQATVSWGAVTGATSYNLYYSTSTGVTKSSGIKIASAVTPQAVTSLTNDTAYYFVVTSVNANGESAESSQVSATPAAPAGETDAQVISAVTPVLNAYTGLFATALPSKTDATLLGLFDSATFMNQGQNLDSFLTEITAKESMIGISFTNLSVLSKDATAGTAVIAFDVMKGGKAVDISQHPLQMIKKTDGKWYIQGDQYIARVKVMARAEYLLFSDVPPNDATVTTISSGLDLLVEDVGGKGITSAVVTGAGITGSVTLGSVPDKVTVVKQTPNNWFTVKTTGGTAYFMTDTQIATIADGDIYTVKLYKGATLAATYTEKLWKAPYLNAGLKASNFLIINFPTLAILRVFAGGDGVVIMWNKPSASVMAGTLTAHINNSDYTASNRVDIPLAPTDFYASADLWPIDSAGQPYILKSGGLWLTAWDTAGRRMSMGLIIMK